MQVRERYQAVTTIFLTDELLQYGQVHNVFLSVVVDAGKFNKRYNQSEVQSVSYQTERMHEKFHFIQQEFRKKI